MSLTKKIGLLSVLVLALAIWVMLLSITRLRIALRITPGFEPLTYNSNIYLEKGAEEYALQLEKLFDRAVILVETKQLRPFKSKPRIYISANHRSFTRHLGLPESTPVRGLAFARDVWLSPLAFAFRGKDTHEESLLHELSHVHMTQQLGYWGRAGKVPAWFSEGLSDWTASMAADDHSRQDAIINIKRGRTFVPDSTGRLPLPKLPQDYGLPGTLLHHQARLFVDYLDYTKHSGMQLLLAELLEGNEFSSAILIVFDVSFAGMWNRFMADVNGGKFPPGKENQLQFQTSETSTINQ